MPWCSAGITIGRGWAIVHTITSGKRDRDECLKNHAQSAKSPITSDETYEHNKYQTTSSLAYQATPYKVSFTNSNLNKTWLPSLGWDAFVIRMITVYYFIKLLLTMGWGKSRRGAMMH